MKQLTLCLLATIATTSIAASARINTQDKRLSNPVTCHFIGTDLKRLVQDMSLQAHVRIRVKPDIADEKLNIFVTKRPLALVQNDITSLFGYRWVSETPKGGQPSYILWRDSNTRDEQTRLLAAAESETNERQKQEIEDIKKYLALSTNDIQNLPKDEGEFAGLTHDNAFQPAYQFLAGLSPQQLNSLLNDGIVSTNLNGAPNGLKDKILGAFQNFDSLQHPDEVSVMDIVSSKWPSSNSPLPPDTLMLRVGDGDGNLIGGHSFPLSKEAAKNLPPKEDKSILAGNLRRFKPKGSKDGLDDPRLAKLIKPLKGEKASFDRGLELIATASDVPIISDYYTTGQMAIPLYSQKAYNATLLLALTYGHSWRWSNGAFLFRFNRWPLQMPKEISLDTLDALKAAGDHGDLNLNQSLLAVHLSDEQLQNLRLYGYRAAWAGPRYDDEKALLTFLGAITPTERTHLTEPDGLEIALLSDSSRAAFEKFYDTKWRNHGYSPVVVSLTMQRNQNAPDMAVFTFNLFLNGNHKESVLEIILGPDKEDKHSNATTPASGGKVSPLLTIPAK